MPNEDCDMAVEMPLNRISGLRKVLDLETFTDIFSVEDNAGCNGTTLVQHDIEMVLIPIQRMA